MAHITIPEGATIQESTRVVYAAATGTGPFSIPFPYFDETDIDVYDDGVLQTLTTDYTISGTAVDGGFQSGELTMVSSVTTSELIIARTIPVERIADFLASGPMPMEELNTTLDKMTAILQEMQVSLDRTFRLADSDSTETFVLPTVAERAGYYLTFDDDGNPTVSETVTPGALTVSSWVENNFLNVADAEAAQSALEVIGPQMIMVPASALTPSTTAGCSLPTKVETTAGSPNFVCCDFDPDTIEYAEFSISMPYSWNKGSMRFAFYWTVNAAVTTDVVWTIEALSIVGDSALDVAFTTSAEVTDSAQGTAHELHYVASGTYTPAETPQDNDLTFFRVSRKATDAADTLLQDARLLGIRITYTTDLATDEQAPA